MSAVDVARRHVAQRRGARTRYAAECRAGAARDAAGLLADLVLGPGLLMTVPIVSAVSSLH